MRALVTGGHGFIGMELMSQLISLDNLEVHCFDKNSMPHFPHGCYAFGEQIKGSVQFHQIDICNTVQLGAAISEINPDWVIHLAAQSHVDESIEAPLACVINNVVGTASILKNLSQHFDRLDPISRRSFRALYVSTDEVYGSIPIGSPPVAEGHKLSTSSPYSASKASGDLLTEAWKRTYGLPIMVTHCTNNYGPGQHPEKFIPRLIARAISGKKLPIFGDGKQTRDWIHVSDHVGALIRVLSHGDPKKNYHIGASNELSNLKIASVICKILDKQMPRTRGAHFEQIEFVTDRPGHDFRYSLDHKRIKAELNWAPKIKFIDGIKNTIEWYIRNSDELKKIAE